MITIVGEAEFAVELTLSQASVRFVVADDCRAGGAFEALRVELYIAPVDDHHRAGYDVAAVPTPLPILVIVILSAVHQAALLEVPTGQQLAANVTPVQRNESETTNMPN